MMKAVLHILLVLSLTISAKADKGGTISKRNSLKEKANSAYEAGKYEEAAVHLSTLIDSLKVDDPKLIYNLANIEMRVEDLESAARRFSQLVATPDKEIRSLAEQHLGVMAAKDGKLEEALSHFKKSLRANPANEQSRYNYELLKSQKEQQDKDKDSDKDDKKDDQQKKDDQNKEDQKQDDQQKQEGDEQKEEGDKGEEKEQEKKEGEEGEESEEEKKDGEKGEQEKEEPEEGEESDEKKDMPTPGEEEGEEEGEGQPQQQKFQEIDISEEKAKMILEALRNREAQYLQQRKRKSDNTRPHDGPDW